MDCLTILAEAGNGARSAGETELFPVDLFWKYAIELNHLEAFVFISFGAVWLFYGWRVFKILVVITFALLGLALGSAISSRIVGLNNQMTGGVIGMLALAILSVPLMRWAVSILGALAGAIFTASIWYATLGEEFIWAGGLIGMVAGGMISFIVFRIAVILFSSMGGGALVVAGSLALLHEHFGADIGLEQIMTGQKWVLPVALMVPLLVGLIAQHKFVKGSKEWEI